MLNKVIYVGALTSCLTALKCEMMSSVIVCNLSCVTNIFSL